jgi:class 3 adenylate cyclase
VSCWFRSAGCNDAGRGYVADSRWAETVVVVRRWWDARPVDGLWTSEDDPSERRGKPDPQAPGEAHRSRLAVFVFADIRGFTRFTTTRGADAAAELATRFIELARGVVTDHNGWFRGTWGDQVLAEFESARDAVRASIALQERCGDATLDDRSLPLVVGVGVDVGEPSGSEAVRTGGAVNRAARLCARAAPGEILTTPELVHLAGPVDTVTYQPRGKATLKGVGTIAVVRIRPTVEDPQRQARLAAVLVDLAERRRPRRRSSSLRAGWCGGRPAGPPRRR